MKVTQMPPVHAANLVANSGNTAYGVDVITYLKFCSNLPGDNELNIKTARSPFSTAWKWEGGRGMSGGLHAFNPLSLDQC